MKNFTLAAAALAVTLSANAMWQSKAPSNFRPVASQSKIELPTLLRGEITPETDLSTILAKKSKGKKAVAEDVIAGEYVFSLGDYYFQGAPGEVEENGSISFEGEFVVLDCDGFPQLPFVGEYDETEGEINFIPINLGLYNFQGGAQYYITAEPCVFNGTDALVLEEYSVKYDEVTQCFAFEPDHGVMWNLYTDEKCTNCLGYYYGMDIFSITKGHIDDGYLHISWPEGVAPETYAAIDPNDYIYDVDVAVVGEDVYVRGLFVDFPDAVIKGEISGGKLTFAGGEYLGDFQGYDIINTPGRVQGEDVYITEGYVLDVDETTKSFYVDSDTSALLEFAPKAQGLLDFVQGISFISFETPDYAVPQPPLGAFWITEYFQQYGMNILQFGGNPLDEKYNILLGSRLSYEIYIDGDLYTFEKDEYPGIPEDEMTRIPYTFYDDLNFEAYTFVRNLYFAIEGIESIGVRMYYENVDGSYSASKIMTVDTVTGNVTLEGETIDEVAAEVAEEGAAEFFNLQGVRVANPEAGQLVIKRQGGKASKLVVK